MKSQFTITICVCPECGEERPNTNEHCWKCGSKLIMNGLFITVENGEIKEVRLTK